MATRHLCRIIVLQALYEWSFWDYPGGERAEEIVERNLLEFGQDIDEPEFARKILLGVAANLARIDEQITNHTKSIPFAQIALLEKNILRIAVYEMLYQSQEEVPMKVAMNEAIELAKNFASDGAAKFVNGVLGSVYEELSPRSDSGPAGQALQRA